MTTTTDQAAAVARERAELEEAWAALSRRHLAAYDLDGRDRIVAELVAVDRVRAELLARQDAADVRLDQLDPDGVGTAG
jgi:hypothetical protein